MRGNGMSVLVVGKQPECEKIQRMLAGVGVSGPVRSADDYLMALGQMAADPPELLISGVDELDDPVEPVAEAMRRLAPRSRMLVTVPAEREVEAVRAVAAGFDDYLLEPIDSGELGRAVRVAAERGASGETGTAEPTNGDISKKIFSEVGGLRAGPSVAGGEAADEEELIGRLLAVDGLACESAVRVIVKRSGIAGAAWSGEAGGVPAGHAAVAVQHGGQKLGYLHAPAPATVRVLEPWGRWLGGWLALERHVTQLSRLAMRDELTGLWNRRYFNRFLETVLSRAADRRFYVSLMIFDIDNFKHYNDTYGHLAGDEILRESARLIQSLVRQQDVVARIGGDEFAVVFWDSAGPRRPNSTHPHDPIKVAERFRAAIGAHRFPKLADQAAGTLTISGGLAGFPWDGRTPRELIDHADKMALQSKRQGKNAIAIGSGAQRNASEAGDSVGP